MAVYYDHRIGTIFDAAYPGLNLRRQCDACKRLLSQMDAAGVDVDVDRSANHIVREANRSALLAFGENRCAQRAAIADAIAKIVAQAKVPVQARCSGMQRSKKHPSVLIGIPVLGQIDLLEQAIALHRLQRWPDGELVDPTFVIVDTGTSDDEQQHLQSLGVPVHRVVFDWDHASEPVCVAMDLVTSLCKSDYLLATHSDCLPCRIDSLSDVLLQCDEQTPAVGYQMSPRGKHPVWDYRRMLSHTFTALHGPTIRKIRLTWSMLGSCEVAGIGDEFYTRKRVSWPDTECGFNRSLWESDYTVDRGIKLLGSEQNMQFDKTQHYWHVRSLTGSSMYEPQYYRKATQWKSEAIAQAAEWQREWAT